MSCLPPNHRSKDRFQDDDENGYCVLWPMDGLLDDLIRAQLLLESASVLDFLAGLLRDSVLLCYASWCYLQWAPRGKLLNLLRRSSKVLRS
jgi:hypothetical protein